MNKNYNKDLIKTIIGFIIIIFILICCSQHKDNNNDNNEACGIDYTYIVDTLNQEYDSIITDTIYKTDNNGKVYKTIILK